MPLHEAIACAVDHGDRQLQHRRRRCVPRPAMYECQIICNQFNRVQILRSISSCWRFKCPRASTVTTAPIRLALAVFEPFTVCEYYKKTKTRLHQGVSTFICGAVGRAQTFVSRVWCIICEVSCWGGEGVGGTTAHPPVNELSGLHDCKIFALKYWSLIWERSEGVKTLGSTRLCSTTVDNERGGQGGGGDSVQSPTGTPLESKGSKKNKSSRETCDPDSTPKSHGNQKQKQTPSPLQSHPQSSAILSTHVHFKCVTININRFLEEKCKYILSLPVMKSVSVIILTEHHLSATFRPKEAIDSGWNIRAVAGVPKRRTTPTQGWGGNSVQKCCKLEN